MIDYVPQRAVAALSPALRGCAAGFEAVGLALYAVGGWVRDFLDDRHSHDMDLTSPASWQQAEALFTACGARVVDRQTQLGTLTVLLGGESYEYTAFRRESYGPGGVHRPAQVSFDATLGDDARRRDFTVNALYLRVHTGEIVDPLGGLGALAQRRLQTCRRPEETFADDGLRLLRMVRFACTLDFTVPDDVLLQAHAHAALLRDLSAERFRGELTRILLCPRVYDALTMMEECGFLDVLLPELTAGRGVAQRREYHDYDVLHHQFHACAHAPANEIDRWAALLHDVGKPLSLAARGDMHAHAPLGADTARALLRRLKYPTAIVDEVGKLIAAHMYDLDGRTKEDKLRWFFARLGPDSAARLLALRRADVLGSKAQPPCDDPAAR
ncbi:MAG: HD domain-containing protein, partial [Eubacteriales bacterium]|nr:HD domain-containing protein [Eubacteriales bacterium]